MATTLNAPMTYRQFLEQFGQEANEYEFWYGEARRRPVPSIPHGVLVVTVGRLLEDADWIVIADVDLHIVPEAHPRPDLIATKRALDSLDYLTLGVEVVVEVVSDSDDLNYSMNKCRRYQEWGFEQIYLANPKSRTVHQWVDESLIRRNHLAGLSEARIWAEFDSRMRRLGAGSTLSH